VSPLTPGLGSRRHPHRAAPRPVPRRSNLGNSADSPAGRSP